MFQVGMKRYVACVLLLMATAVKAETIIIEGSPGLPVATSFVFRLAVDDSWVKEKLRGKEIIESRLVLSTQSGTEIKTLTAIPSPTGKLVPYSPDYVVRYSHAAGINHDMPACAVFINSPDGPKDVMEFDCSLDTVSVIRLRAECAATGGTWDFHRTLVSKRGECFPDTQIKCLNRDGKWRQVTRFGQPLICSRLLPDAGKDCTDKSQCTGECLPDDERKPDENGVWVGKCQKHDGDCVMSIIANGKYVSRISSCSW